MAGDKGEKLETGNYFLQMPACSATMATRTSSSGRVSIHPVNLLSDLARCVADAHPLVDSREHCNRHHNCDKQDCRSGQKVMSRMSETSEGRRSSPRPAPLVSVLFTSFNHARYVEEALDSLRHQTSDNFEVIITDDASTDGCAEVI